MAAPVYLTRISKFLPNAPVANEEMEHYLGMIDGKPSRARRIVLKSNGIRTRHYVIEPASGKVRYTNARLTAEAVRGLVDSDFHLDDIELLSCGTSSPDQLAPNHASMVHGELGNPTCETVATAGVCLSGVAALKYGYMAVASGLVHNAVATGSEMVSPMLHAKNFPLETEANVSDLENRPEAAFEKDFLRWMLSDGAGAILLEDTPNADGLSMRIDWIEMRSYAHELETCMYNGAVKQRDGSLRGWREFDTLQDAVDHGAFSVHQDVKLLNANVMPVTVSRGLSDILKRRALNPDDVDWFLPHYSSNYFRSQVQDCLRAIGFDIPQQRWFTNLERVGNAGAASIYLMIEELLNGGHCRAGDRVLCYVPESGRFSTGFIKMTVVSPDGTATRQ